MAEIGQLGNLNSAEPLDMDMYKGAIDGQALPKAGRYQVRAPDSFPATSFSATKAGFLSAQVDPTIIGPSNEGYNIRYTKVSAKPFKRGGVPASQLGDYLKACGKQGTIPGEPQAQADAVEATANAVYQVDVDWRAYSKASGFVLEGMKNFPSDGNGEYLPWTTDPQEKGENGEPLRLRANLIVTRYVPAS